MKLLQKVVKQLEEDCGCGQGPGPGQGSGVGISPQGLMSFMVTRGRAEEEEADMEQGDPVGPSPEGDDRVNAQLKQFFKTNPNPADDEVHALADEMGMEHSDLEERIYGLLHQLLAGDDEMNESVSSKSNQSKATNFDTDIEKATIENDNFRKVLFTTSKSQLVLMSLKPGEDIGMETHNGDQFFRFEKGNGKVILNGQTVRVKDGSSVTVREGTKHNVVNMSKTEDLKLYAIYSPPQHKDGTINATKPEGNEEHE